MSLSIKQSPEGLIIKVRVQPRSSKNRIAGLHDDALKINLTAPPVDNAANKACTAFVAKQLGLAKSAVSIRSGHTSRNKQVMVSVQGQGKQKIIRETILSWAK